MLVVPALIVAVTLRSSGSVFSVVLNFTVVAPLSPLVGEAVHQDVPFRDSAIDNVQFAVAEKEMDFSDVEESKDKPFVWILDSRVIVGLLTSGFAEGGTTGSSLPLSLHADKHNKNASNANPIILNVFIL